MTFTTSRRRHRRPRVVAPLVGLASTDEVARVLRWAEADRFPDEATLALRARCAAALDNAAVATARRNHR